MATKKAVGAKKKERELAREWRKNGKNSQEIAQLYLGKVTDGCVNPRPPEVFL